MYALNIFTLTIFHNFSSPSLSIIPALDQTPGRSPPPEEPPKTPVTIQNNVEITGPPSQTPGYSGSGSPATAAPAPPAGKKQDKSEVSPAEAKKIKMRKIHFDTYINFLTAQGVSEEMRKQPT